MRLQRVRFLSRSSTSCSWYNVSLLDFSSKTLNIWLFNVVQLSSYINTALIHSTSYQVNIQERLFCMTSAITNFQLLTVSMSNPATVIPNGGLEEQYHCYYPIHLSQHPKSLQLPSWGWFHVAIDPISLIITVFFQRKPTVVAFRPI